LRTTGRNRGIDGRFIINRAARLRGADASASANMEADASANIEADASASVRVGGIGSAAASTSALLDLTAVTADEPKHNQRRMLKARR
jgi:hypothetical protein